MHLKGLHSYNYPEVTNILLGQVQWTMMSHNSDITTLTYHARSLSADVLFADIAITAFEDRPAGDTSDTYITAPGHKFKDGDTVEIDNTTNRLFVTNQRSNSVSVIDLIEMQNVKTINVGEYPEGIDLHPNNNHLYVANWFDNIVSVIDISNLEVITEIQVGEGCRAYGEFISR